MDFRERTAPKKNEITENNLRMSYELDDSDTQNGFSKNSKCPLKKKKKKTYAAETGNRKRYSLKDNRKHGHATWSYVKITEHINIYWGSIP